MTIYQTGANMLVALKRETTTGVAAGASGGTQMRALASPGLVLTRAQIQSQEKRSDMLKTLGRLGGKSVAGSYSAELTVGGATDILAEAIMRSTWVATVALTSDGGAVWTNFQVDTAHTITATGTGSFLTTCGGAKVGDIIVLTNYSTAADNNVNLRVTGVAASVLTFAETLTIGATDAACTVTIQKKVKNGATPTRYSHTIEQYYADIDQSEQFLGCRLTGFKLSFKPGAMATIAYTFMGIDRVPLATGSSPYFTTPALTTGLDLIADDSSIRYNGASVGTFTGFDLDFTITAKGEPVLGNNFLSPDIFDNDLNATGTITELRSDFSSLTAFDAETEFEVSILLQEPTGSPKPFFNVFLPRVKIGGVSTALLGDGAAPETLPLMIGAKVAASGYDGTLATFSSSAP